MSTIIYHLYVKTHNITGLKYLGQTQQDPYKYMGSGKYWNLHLKKNGRKITTEILFSTTNKKELEEKGLYYSNLWNIVESDQWANLKPEEGAGNVRGSTLSPETKRKISKANKGRIVSEETREKIRIGHLGKKKPPLSLKHKESISKALKGHITTIETRNKISEYNRNRKITDQMKINMSNAQKKLYKNGYISPFKGKSKSLEQRIKISETLKRRQN